jgi:hypothetical protein
MPINIAMFLNTNERMAVLIAADRDRTFLRFIFLRLSWLVAPWRHMRETRADFQRRPGSLRHYFFAAQGLLFAAQGLALAAHGLAFALALAGLALAAQGLAFAAQGFALAAQGLALAAQGLAFAAHGLDAVCPAQGLAFILPDTLSAATAVPVRPGKENPTTPPITQNSATNSMT